MYVLQNGWLKANSFWHVCIIFLLLTGAERADARTPLLTFKVTGRGIRALAFLPDGKTLAGVQRQDVRHNNKLVSTSTIITFWDLKTAKVKWTFKIPDAPSAFAFSPSGKLLAVGTGQQLTGSVQLYDVQTGKLRRTLAKGSITDKGITGIGPVSALAFSSDGKSLNVGVTLEGEYKLGGYVLVLGANSGKTLRTFKVHSESFDSFEISSVTQKVAVNEGKRIDVCSLKKGRILRTLQIPQKPTLSRQTSSINRVNEVCFSSDGKLLFSSTSDGALRVWNARTGVLIKTLTKVGDSDFGIAVSKNGSMVAINSEQGIKVMRVD